MDTTSWYSRPIFISSTFKDMQAERDHLRDVVFPELERRFRERKGHLEPIDLRWGVETVSSTEQEQKELLVLKVCLDEIERSRPFLLVLLGDRYGWVPPERRMRAAINEKAFETDVSDKSVTALEIEYGVLDSPEQCDRSFFYFREALPYEQMTPEQAAFYSDANNPDPDGQAAHHRLQALKARIEADETLKPRVHRYRAEWKEGRVTGLEAWGKQVTEDIWRELDAETTERAENLEPGWQGEESRSLDAFIELRSRDFVGRKKLLDDLTSAALSHSSSNQSEKHEPVWAISLQGQPGSGKSALMAKLHRTLETENCLLLTHAAGISPRSTSVESLLRRWCQELGRYLQLQQEDPTEGITDFEELKNRFRELLARAAAQIRIICLIDALNQFERTLVARHLTWLPKLWPENARLISSAIPGDETGVLNTREGVKPIDLPALELDEADLLARTLGQRHRKSLPKDILLALKRKLHLDGTPVTGNPLWLTLALEQLLLLDEDDFGEAERGKGTPEQKLHAYMQQMAEGFPPPIEALYDHLFQRAESFAQRQGIDWIPELLDLIATSRHGLRETDLRSLLNRQQAFEFGLQFANVRRYLRAHFSQRGEEGMWDFTHVQPRLLLQRRQQEQLTEKVIHQRLADYFEALPQSDPLHESETMVHLIGAQKTGCAANYYASELSEGELKGATAILAEKIIVGEEEKTNAGVEWMQAMLEAEGLALTQQHQLVNRINFDLYKVLETCTWLATRETLFQNAFSVLEQISVSDPGNAAWQRDLSVGHERIGNIRQAQGGLASALDAFLAALLIRERLSASDPSNTAWQRDLSASHIMIGDIRQAQGDLTAAMDAFLAALLIRERLSASDPGNTAWQQDLSVSHIRIGDIRQAQGDLTGALDAFRAAFLIAEWLSTSDLGNAAWQCNLSVSHDRIGDIRQVQGDLTGALDAFLAALLIRERLSASDPGNAVWQRDLSVGHIRIGDIRQVQGDLTGALDAFRAALLIAERLSASDPDNAAWQRDLALSHGWIGDICQAQGDLTGALDSFRAAFLIRELLSVSDPGNAVWQCDLSLSHDRIGNIRQVQGDLTAALDAFHAAFLIAERLSVSDPGNAVWQRGLSLSHDRIGDIRQAQGDLTAALDAFRAALLIRERQSASDPCNAEWQCDLSRSHNKIGNIRQAQGDLIGALGSFRAALLIRERQSASDQCNAEWQRNLSVSHVKISDIRQVQGDLTGALGSFRVALLIAERLSASDPSNAEWQRDLVVTFYKIASLADEAGKPEEAGGYWIRCYAVLQGMKSAGMFLDPPLIELLEMLDEQL